MENFKDLGVQGDIIKGINELGILVPTDIQKQVIPALLENQIDLIGHAQTGTGKTAAYGLPLIQKIDPKLNQIQGLVLCPTRELGQQVAKQLFKFTKYTDKIFVESVYGGAQIIIQDFKFDKSQNNFAAQTGSSLIINKIGRAHV